MKRFYQALLCVSLMSWGHVSYANSPLFIYTEVSPPYQVVDGNRVGGEATQRVRQIVERAGLDAQFKIYPWARAMLSVQRSTRALIYSMAKTPEREANFHWIAPVATFEFSIITLQSRADTLADGPLSLEGLSVAAQRDDISAKWLKARGFVEGENLMMCADIVCSWQQLKLGTVDFIIEDPNLIEDTARLVGLTAEDVRLHQSVPELSTKAYLAANAQMEDQIVERLKQAASELGFQ